MTPRFLLLAAASAVTAIQPASAQTPYPAGNPYSAIAPRLPITPVSPDARPRPFLTAARNAVLDGRTGEAGEALERAETRLLNRPGPSAVAASPDLDRATLDVGTARRSLVARDRPGALRAIDDAILELQAAPAPSYAAVQPPPLASAPLNLLPRVPALAPAPAFSQPPSLLPSPPPQPYVTYALLPGHWQLDGARYVWIPPETTLRQVVERPLVGGVNVWKYGRWVFVPEHFAGANGR